MKRLLFILLGCVILYGCVSSADHRVLAHVGDGAIHVSDLKKIYAEESPEFSPEILADPEGSFTYKQTLLNNLIQEKLLLQTAEEKKITLTPEEEKRAADTLGEDYTQASLQKILESRHIRYEDWLRRQHAKALITKLIDQEITSKVSLDPGEVERYYQQHRKHFREPDRIHCLHIVAGKREKAKTIRSLLEKGENFAAIAKQYSESPDRDQGGDLGYIARGEYPAIFEAACFSLALGQTSDIVPSEYGFHVFRVIDKKPGHLLTLHEVRTTIEMQLREEKAKPLLRSWLDETYQNAKISIDEEALKGLSLQSP